MSAARLSPLARRELRKAMLWIGADNPSAARALLEAVDKAARRIGTHRYCGAIRPEIADQPYRFVALAGYPYLLVYNAELDPPLIVRLLHGARDLPRALRQI